MNMQVMQNNRYIMKTLKLILFTLLAVILNSCYTDEHFIVPEDDSYLSIELFNEIIQTATTRVNDEGFCDGDAVGIYVVNFENGQSGTMQVEGNQADNVKYVYDEYQLHQILIS